MRENGITIPWQGIGVLLLIGLIIGAVYLVTSWMSIGQSEALLMVDAGSHTVTLSTTGPSTGLMVNGFARIFGFQNPVVIYYGMDSVSMWTEWEETSPGVFVEKARGDYPAINVLSKDGLPIDTDVQVRWSFKQDALVELYKRYPRMDWKDAAINSIVRRVIRDTIGSYTAIDIIEKRQEIGDVLQVNMRIALLKDPTLQGVIEENNVVVDLRDIDPEINFVKSVSAKLAAEQAKFQAQFDYERGMILAQLEADQKLVIANGTRDAINTILSITGETNSTKIAELYMQLEAYKQIAPNANSLIIIWGQDQVPTVLPIETPP